MLALAVELISNNDLSCCDSDWRLRQSVKQSNQELKAFEFDETWCAKFERLCSAHKCLLHQALSIIFYFSANHASQTNSREEN
jgi:hypothetical protein